MTDRLRLVARKDVGDAVRDREAHTWSGLFVLSGLGVGYIAGTTTGLSVALVGLGLGAVLGPLAALVLSQNAIVGKKLSGELTVLLGLPLSRATIVLGSVLGRFALVAATTTAGLLAGAALSALLGSVPNVPAVCIGLVVVLALTLVFTSLAVAVSTLARSSTWASVGIFALFGLFTFRLWTAVPGLIDSLLRLTGVGRLPSWVGQIWSSLDPYVATRNAVAPLTGPVEAVFSALANGPPPANPAFYERPVVALGIVAAWGTVPLLAAYRRFATRDL